MGVGVELRWDGGGGGAEVGWGGDCHGIHK